MLFKSPYKSRLKLVLPLILRGFSSVLHDDARAQKWNIQVHPSLKEPIKTAHIAQPGMPVTFHNTRIAHWFTDNKNHHNGTMKGH